MPSAPAQQKIGLELALSSIFFVLLLLLARPALANNAIIEVAGGAGGASTTGDLGFYTSGFATLLGGGWAFGIFQVKGELFDYFYFSSKQYQTIHNRDLAFTTLATIDLGINIANTVVFTGGYGYGLVENQEDFSASAINQTDEKIASGGAWVAGLDIYPIHSGKLDIGVLGRMFWMVSNSYTDTLSSYPGNSVSNTYAGVTVKSAGFFVLGGLTIHLN